MLKYDSPEASVERFIGALTMALGIGGLVPRPGLGLYSLLEHTGARGLISIGMLNLGTLAIIISFFEVRSMRLVTVAALFSFWMFLIDLFISAGLWGAACQAVVVILFCINCFYLLVRNEIYPKPKTAPKRRKH